MKQTNYHVLGVMSGTSLDGIDVAEIHLTTTETGDWEFEIAHAETISYPETWKAILQQAISFSEAELKDLNSKYTNYLAKIISEFITRHSIVNLDAVCSHGHTILHQPQNGITLQIGNLPHLATLLKQKVVCDFRVQDVALGGQGAPLVPIGDSLLFKEYDYCLNLGGFANCSFDKNGTRIAYDICPVNIVLNALAEKLNHPYDAGGKIAQGGVLNESLLRQLNELEFYRQSAPKSLGLEWVQRYIQPVLGASEASEVDKLRTFTEHVAIQLSLQFKKESSVFITGGGVYNEFLIARLNHHQKLNLVIPSPTLIEYKEALIFGLLGVLKLRDEINCLASVTGAERDHSAGNVFFSN